MMKDKLARLIELISDNREEIVDIVRSTNEYYFSFRDKVFSISGPSSSGGTSFFVYPKWRHTASQLVATLNATTEEHPDANYVYILGSEISRYLGRDFSRDLFAWLESKNTGLDQLFEDLGIY